MDGRSTTGKVMPFSQSVLGTEPKSSSMKGKMTGTWVAPSVGKVDMNPSKPSAPKTTGKRVY